MNEYPESSRKLSTATDELTERQRAAIALLVAGKTYTAAADELGVNRRTVWEWKQQAAFQAALTTELEALREAVHTRLLALADKAVSALERTLESGDSDSARVAAARLVLDRLSPKSAANADDAPEHGRQRVIVVREKDMAAIERSLMEERG